MAQVAGLASARVLHRSPPTNNHSVRLIAGCADPATGAVVSLHGTPCPTILSTSEKTMPVVRGAFDPEPTGEIGTRGVHERVCRDVNTGHRFQFSGESAVRASTSRQPPSRLPGGYDFVPMPSWSVTGGEPRCGDRLVQWPSRPPAALHAI